jgi:pyruvyltransferase
MQLFWWRVRPNVGDAVTPDILRQYGARNIRWVHRSKPGVLLGVGSILTAKAGNGVKLWTTGMIAPCRAPQVGKAYAVRGKLTARALGRPHLPVGDGGLLVRKMDYVKPFVKAHGAITIPKTIGLIPHFTDMGYVHSWVAGLTPEQRVRFVVFDVAWSPQTFLTRLAEVDFVFSSSLHGLIFADSLRIPNRQFSCPTSHKIGGYKFKYRDYYSAFNEIPAPSLQFRHGTGLYDKLIEVSMKRARGHWWNRHCRAVDRVVEKLDRVTRQMLKQMR